MRPTPAPVGLRTHRPVVGPRLRSLGATAGGCRARETTRAQAGRSVRPDRLGSHPAIPRVVLDLSQSQDFHNRRDTVAEPALGPSSARTLRPPGGLPSGPMPRLLRPRPVLAGRRSPARSSRRGPGASGAGRSEPQLVTTFGLAESNHQSGRAASRVGVRLVLRSPARGPQVRWVSRGSLAAHLISLLSSTRWVPAPACSQLSISLYESELSWIRLRHVVPG